MSAPGLSPLIWGPVCRLFTGIPLTTESCDSCLDPAAPCGEGAQGVVCERGWRCRHADSPSACSCPGCGGLSKPSGLWRARLVLEAKGPQDTAATVQPCQVPRARPWKNAERKRGVGSSWASADGLRGRNWAAWTQNFRGLHRGSGRAGVRGAAAGASLHSREP